MERKMFMEIIKLLIGFFIIVKASDVLVDCASSLALKLKISKSIIALTIISFGTCAPEIAISFQSIEEGNSQIAFSNIIGSCIVNVFLIIGLASLIKPIKAKEVTVKKELPILLIVTSGFTILMLNTILNPLKNQMFTKIDGIILLLLFLIFVYYIIQTVKSKGKTNENIKPMYDPYTSIIFLILSIILIIYSSDLIVNNVELIAKNLNLSEKIITMTAIVIGTSLPEMVMTITSAKKGEFDIALGNIIGTNIFNICIVLGLPITIYGSIKLIDFNVIDIITVFLTSFLLYIFAKTKNTIEKKEAIIMLLIFIFYYTCTIML